MINNASAFQLWGSLIMNFTLYATFLLFCPKWVNFVTSSMGGVTLKGS